MKSGGHLGRIRFDLQFENVCDRSEDRLASVVTFLPVRLGQPASPLRQGSDPGSLQAVSIRWVLFWGLHFSISSSKGKRVKNS
jgi:hypothetical protein